MIIGHQKQWQFLKKSAELGKLPHGLLFCGQGQLGKKTLAIELVKFLNCQSVERLRPHTNKIGSDGPCQICRNCQDIKKGVYPDFVLVESDPLREQIQISQMRNLIEKLSLRPYSAFFKIAIIDRAHLMSQEAQNCFLKFLEEPKGNVILILVTEYPQLLLPTILSRVQKLRFFPVKSTEIESYLLSQGIPEEKTKYLSSFSFGKPGQALDFLLNPQKLDNQKKYISDLIKISNSDLASRFQYAKSLVEKKADVETKDFHPHTKGGQGTKIDKVSPPYGVGAKEVLDTWLRYFRNIFLLRLNRQAHEERAFSQYSLSKLKDIIELIQTTNFLVSTTNVNLKLALENLLIKI